jgi:integrase
VTSRLRRPRQNAGDVRPDARPSKRSGRPAPAIIRAINSRDIRDIDRPQRRAVFGEPQLGLKRVSWLTLRRTYSSWAHEKGVPGKVVAQLMGHAKVDTTLNVYTQVIDGALRTAVDKVGSELFTIVHNPEKGAEPSR